MANETTTSEAAPAANTTETPSPLQETPSSTVDNIPQADGDFATWLSDRLDKFEKGEEKAPWTQNEDEKAGEPDTEVKETAEPSAEEEKTEESSDEAEDADKDTEEGETDDAEETKSMSAAAGAKFKELKAELKEYKTKLAEAQKAAEEAKSTPANSEEVESLRARLTEYEQEIAVARVEATPEYKQAVLQPTQAILDAAAALADRYKVDARKLVNALRDESVTEGSDTLTEMAGDFSERDRVRLYRMADDLTEVARRREFLRDNASKAMEEMEQKRAQMEKAREVEMKKEMDGAVDKAWSEVFEGKEFTTALDSEVIEKARKYAKETDYYNTPLEERAYAVYSGLILPAVVAKYEETRSKMAELEKALSKYKKASPKVSGNTDTTPQVSEDTGFLDAIEKRFSLG
jgi:hypothetical protein